MQTTLHPPSLQRHSLHPTELVQRAHRAGHSHFGPAAPLSPLAPSTRRIPCAPSSYSLRSAEFQGAPRGAGAYDTRDIPPVGSLIDLGN